LPNAQKAATHINGPFHAFQAAPQQSPHSSKPTLQTTTTPALFNATTHSIHTMKDLNASTLALIHTTIDSRTINASSAQLLAAHVLEQVLAELARVISSYKMENVLLIAPLYIMPIQIHAYVAHPFSADHFSV
jgi:hypothetical protein